MSETVYSVRFFTGCEKKLPPRLRLAWSISSALSKTIGKKERESIRYEAALHPARPNTSERTFPSDEESARRSVFNTKSDATVIREKTCGVTKGGEGVLLFNDGEDEDEGSRE